MRRKRSPPAPSIAAAQKRHAAAIRSQARAARQRAKALRSIADAFDRAARDTTSPESDTRRYQGRLASDLAKIVDAEADTFDREATRVDAQRRASLTRERATRPRPRSKQW